MCSILVAFCGFNIVTVLINTSLLLLCGCVVIKREC